MEYKTKDRIIKYGEVYTKAKTINEMLNLIPSEFFNNDNIKILEPAVGTGNFLVEILKRKTQNKSIEEIKKIISNIYAYDILEDNIKDTINNIQLLFDFDVKDILSKNFQVKDFLKEKFDKNQFDLVIGNPPYQIPDNSYGRGAMPLYNKFIEKIIDEINPTYFSFIIPSRWLTGGKGLQNFRKKMLNNNNFEIIVDSLNSKNYFDNVYIEGGILYFLWNKNYNGLCNYTLIEENNTKKRKLNQFDIFIRSNNGLKILEKVLKKHNNSNFLNNLVKRSNFGFKTNYSDFKLKKDEIYNIKFYSKHKLLKNQNYGFIKFETIKNQKELLDKHKVIITKARGGVGKDKKIITDVLITDKGSVTSQSYLILNYYDDKEKALEFSNYIKTKFVRYLIKLRKYTQDISINTFRFVPTFSNYKNLTDEYLYNYFSLNDEEIKIIESNIDNLS